MQILWDVAEIREYGTKKYKDPDNWKRVEMQRYVDALLRHTLAFVEDHHSVDEESGLAHYKHMACNMAFICAMMEGKSVNPEDKKSVTKEDAGGCSLKREEEFI